MPDEIRSWRAVGIGIVVSLLTDEETAELGLADEQALCRRVGVEFRRYPIEDRGVPDDAASFETLVRRLAEDIRRGEAVAIHCRAGIGRSALAAAATLCVRGIDVARAFECVSAARGLQVPDTDEQRLWLARFAERHMGGAL